MRPRNLTLAQADELFSKKLFAQQKQKLAEAYSCDPALVILVGYRSAVSPGGDEGACEEFFSPVPLACFGTLSPFRGGEFAAASVSAHTSHESRAVPFGPLLPDCGNSGPNLVQMEDGRGPKRRIIF